MRITVHMPLVGLPPLSKTISVERMAEDMRKKKSLAAEERKRVASQRAETLVQIRVVAQDMEELS